MITEKQVEQACDFLRDNAKKFAKAKAERIYLMEFRKSQKALLIHESEGTIQQRESFAYGHFDYIEILEGIKKAVEEEEYIRWQMIAAQTKVELFRTQESSNRMIDKTHR